MTNTNRGYQMQKYRVLSPTRSRDSDYSCGDVYESVVHIQDDRRCRNVKVSCGYIVSRSAPRSVYEDLTMSKTLLLFRGLAVHRSIIFDRVINVCTKNIAVKRYRMMSTAVAVRCKHVYVYYKIACLRA